MGRSASAHIVFGFRYERPDGDDEDEEPRLDIEEQYGKARGVGTDFEQVQKVWEEDGLQIVRGGALYDGEGDIVVAIDEVGAQYDWEEPTTLDLKMFEADERPWVEKLKKFCEVMKIRVVKPTWLVVVGYG